MAAKKRAASPPKVGPVEMKTELVAISSLTPDPNNARRHGEENLAKITAGLKAHGQQKPIVVSKDRVVIAGNGTLEAAKRLGWTMINVVVSTLTGAQAAAYAVSDNRTGETSSWDYEVLARTLNEIESAGLALDVTGWSPEEITNFIGAADWTPPVGGDLDDISPTRVKALKFDSSQWDALVKALGTGDPKKLAAEVIRRLVP